MKNRLFRRLAVPSGLLLPLFVLLTGAAPSQTSAKTGAATESFYDLTLPSLEGDPVDMSVYRGKVTLVVNVASHCGYTPQYSGLEELHRELSPRGFAVLGFPSNDFGGQEPGDAEEIRSFCSIQYGVTFPIFQKVVTRPGPLQSPAFAFLGRSGKLPAWNFSKYVLDRDGRVVAFFPSQVTPESPELRAAIERAMKATIRQ